jgi:hypothetical protein
MKTRQIIGLFLAILSNSMLTGCSPVVQARVSPTEFLVAGEKNPGKVDLFITEEFRSHIAEKTDISEFKQWKFELGTVAADAFRYALESRFETVSVRLGTPQFPSTPPETFYAAVQPSFTSFGASDPVLFRFENYKATIGFDVAVYRADGTTLFTRAYTGEGTQQGSIGYDDPGLSAYPVAVQNAVKDAAVKFVDDLVASSNQP